MTTAEKIIEMMTNNLYQRQATFDMNAHLSDEFLKLVNNKPFELKSRTIDGIEDAFRRKYEAISKYYSVICKRGEDNRGMYVKITVSPNKNLGPDIEDELDITFNYEILLNPEKYGLEISKTRKVRLIDF